MTVHFWGENPKGTWTLIVTDNDRNTREHHVLKAKQGDFEDVTRVVMDDTEKQGPWDANEINEYDTIKQTPPGNHTSQDHILKGMENTMGELVKGNKFTELAKRKKDRHHGLKGIVGKKSAHAQYRQKNDKQKKKSKYKTTKKKALKNNKTNHKSKKHKDLKSDTKEITGGKKRNRKKKHKYYKHKGTKRHNYKSHKKHSQKQKDSRVKGQGQGSLMAEGSVEIPKGRTPLEAKIAIQALMKPYFKVSASRIVLPKQYQGFMGEVDIKMKVVRERNNERMGTDGSAFQNHITQLESAKNSNFSKAQSPQGNTSRTPNISNVVKQSIEVQNATRLLGDKPFGIPSKDLNVLEAAGQNTETSNLAPVRIPDEIQGKGTNENNVYINLLNTIKSIPRYNKKAMDSSLRHLDERIDILTDAKPYTHEHSTSVVKNLHNEVNSTGNEFTRRNTTGSQLTGNNDTGNDLTGNKSIGNASNRNAFIESSASETNISSSHLNDDTKGGTLYDTMRNVDVGNEAVRPDVIPIIVYDAERNQYIEVTKLNATDQKMLTGSEITGTGRNITGTNLTGSNITGNGSNISESGSNILESGSNITGKGRNGVKEEQDEGSSGFGGSSGVLIEEGADCEDGNDNEVKCQVNEQDNNGLMIPTGEKPNDAVQDANEDDDNDDDENDDTSDETENVHVTDDVRGFPQPQPQGPHDFQISKNLPTAKMEPTNDEDKLAFLLSTGKYQGSLGGTFNEGLGQVRQLRPLNASDSKDSNVPNSYNMSTGPTQAKESKSLQSPTKHQNVPSPTLKGLSHPAQKGPLHQNVPDRPVQEDDRPASNNQDIKIDLSELEPLDQFANKDFRALENALEKQVARLEKFRDDSPTGTRFLQRVKDDIRQRNIDDLKFIEDEIRNDMREEERQDERKAYSDGDSFIMEPGQESSDSDEDLEDNSEESHRLERRRLSKRASKQELFHRGKNAKGNDKYGKGNSGILKSWTLILYGT